MQSQRDEMGMIRAELCERLESLRSYSERQGPRDFARTVAGISRLAAAYGLTPVVRLAEALERAARMSTSGGRETALYLDRLQDAIGCTRVDEAASEAMIASVSVRFGA
jgi:hypothetical protein